MYVGVLSCVGRGIQGCIAPRESCQMYNDTVLEVNCKLAQACERINRF